MFEPDEMVKVRVYNKETGQLFRSIDFEFYEPVIALRAEVERLTAELAALREQARNCPPHDWTDWTDKENLADGFPVCKKCGVKWGHSDNSQDDVINFFRELEDLPPAPEEVEK